MVKLNPYADSNLSGRYHVSTGKSLPIAKYRVSMVLACALLASAAAAQQQEKTLEAMYDAYDAYLGQVSEENYGTAVQQIAIAYELSAQLLPETDLDAANLAYNYGTGLLWTGQAQAAIPVLTDALGKLERSGEDEQVLRLVHGYLVQAYHESGDTLGATPHCLAIGRSLAVDSPESMVPVYQPRAGFSAEALSLSDAPLTVEFTVDEQGYVQSLNVVGELPHKRLVHEAFDIAEATRFAPAFVDGTPRPMPGVQLTYELREQQTGANRPYMGSMQSRSSPPMTWQSKWNSRACVGPNCR
jgi:hypothetical protein